MAWLALGGATLTTLKTIPYVAVIALAHKVSGAELSNYLTILDKAFDTMYDTAELYEKIKEETIKLVNSSVDNITGMYEKLKEETISVANMAVEGVTGKYEEFKGETIKVANAVIDDLTGMYEKLKEETSDIANTSMDNAAQMYEKFKQETMRITDTALDNVMQMYERFKQETIGAANAIMDDAARMYEKFKEETVKATNIAIDLIEAIKLGMEMKKLFMAMEYAKIAPARIKPKVKENGWTSTPQVFNGPTLGISELGVSLVALNELYREMNNVGGMISKDHVRKLNKCKDANANIRRRYSSSAAYSGCPEVISQCIAIDRKIDEVKATLEKLGKEMGKDAISIKKAIDIYAQTEKEAKALIKVR